jgi:hypothetical protein
MVPQFPRLASSEYLVASHNRILIVDFTGVRFEYSVEFHGDINGASMESKR